LRSIEKTSLLLLITICSSLITQGQIKFTSYAQTNFSPTLPFPAVETSPQFKKAASACNILAISSVTASGSQVGNPASNAIDANLNTRWANQGIGSSITVDFSKERAICNVNIAWYRGTERTFNFVIAVSKDGIAFTNVFSGKSSGTTDGLETYDFPDTTGRYVKITINGNTLNNWASLSEIRVLGDLLNTQPPPSPPTVTSTNPSSGANGVPLSTKIKATFTQPILASSVSSSTFSVKPSGSSSNIAGSYSLSAPDGGKTVVFSPTSMLKPSTTYLATLTTGIKDQSGDVLASAKTWSFSTVATSPNPPPPPANECNRLTVDKATEAGGVHSLGPKYAVDGNLTTRWSEQGIGSSLTLDVGKKHTICNIEVSWYRGSERISNFVISLSKNDKSYTDVFSGKSSGTISSFERYDFGDTDARYVKITVSGNTINDWASKIGRAHV